MIESEIAVRLMFALLASGYIQSIHTVIKDDVIYFLLEHRLPVNIQDKVTNAVHTFP